MSPSGLKTFTLIFLISYRGLRPESLMWVWVPERMNAWTGRSRRNSKDYERKPESAAAMIQISHLHLMLRKLAPTDQREFRYDAAVGEFPDSLLAMIKRRDMAQQHQFIVTDAMRKP